MVLRLRIQLAITLLGSVSFCNVGQTYVINTISVDCLDWLIFYYYLCHIVYCYYPLYCFTLHLSTLTTMASPRLPCGRKAGRSSLYLSPNAFVKADLMRDNFSLALLLVGSQATNDFPVSFFSSSDSLDKIGFLQIF